jgi:integrase/recombinase XerD
MKNFTGPSSAPSGHLVPFTDQLWLAVAAYLARFKGTSRYHTESDLRCYLAWCAEHGLDPLAARRPHLELYIRWMQEVRRFKPSTVSRRFSVTAGFYRTCVIDGLLEHSPAEHVRRPSVPPESPTLGFTHLQFEALLTAARESPNPFDFALVTMLGLLGLRIFEATGADIADLGEEHGHRVLRVCGKGTKVVLIPLPPAAGRAIDRAIGTRARGPILLNTRSARMDRHAATRRLRHLAEVAGVRIAKAAPTHAPPHVRDDHARCGRGSARCPDRCPARGSADHDAVRPGPQEPRPSPQLHPRRLHGLRHLTTPASPHDNSHGETPGIADERVRGQARGPEQAVASGLIENGGT